MKVLEQIPDVAAFTMTVPSFLIVTYNMKKQEKMGYAGVVEIVLPKVQKMINSISKKVLCSSLTLGK